MIRHLIHGSLPAALVLGVLLVPGLKRTAAEATGIVRHGSPVKFKAALESRISTLLALEAPHLAQGKREEIRREVIGAALGHGVDPLFILALMRAESRFDPRAVSSQGALGLLQLQPATARWFAARHGSRWDADASLFDPGTNIRIGIGYFAYLYRRFGDVGLSLRAYHRGPGAVRREGRVPELGTFARRVLAQYRRYRTISACETAACPADAEWTVGGERSELAAACQDAATFC